MTDGAPETAPAAATTPFVVVRTGQRQLALPLRPVIEVARMVAMAARLPRAPRNCLGIIDFRGQLVPVLDLGARLGLTPERRVVDFVDGHILLLDDSLGIIGYAVDEVRELGEQTPEELPAVGGAMAAVRCADETLAPLVQPSALLTVVARHMLRLALERHHEASR